MNKIKIRALKYRGIFKPRVEQRDGVLERQIGRITIECIVGDIAAQKDCRAVVNAANAQLLPGGGVAGAIHIAAGPGLAVECRKWAPIKPGEAVMTSGHNLPNQYVIHCLGPIYGKDKPSDLLLANCYRNALKIMQENKIDSIAFPAISTGVFGYPKAEAARVAFKTIIDMVGQLDPDKRIRFVLHTKSDLEIHQKVLSELTA